MQKIHTTMTPWEWLLLVILSILWGGSFFFVGVAVKALPPFTIVALRVSLASLLLITIVYFSGKGSKSVFKVWPIFLLMGIMNNVIPFSLIVWGQTQIASGLAAILNATTPLFAVVGAHLLTSDEKMTLPKISGVILGFTGVAIMIGVEAFSHLGTNILAQLGVLGASLSYALGGIYGKRFSRMGIDPLVTSTGQVCASSLILLPLACMVDTPWKLGMPGMEVWGAIFGIAFFSTALAYILYFRIISTAGAINASLVTLLIPVSAVILGSVFLEERLAIEHYLGMAFIGLGLMVIDGRLLKSGKAFLQVSVKVKERI